MIVLVAEAQFAVLVNADRYTYIEKLKEYKHTMLHKKENKEMT